MMKPGIVKLKIGFSPRFVSPATLEKLREAKRIQHKASSLNDGGDGHVSVGCSRAKGGDFIQPACLQSSLVGSSGS